MRILWIEDDRRVRRLVSAALRAAEHYVVEGQTCAEALGELDGRKYDLLVLDLGLPDGSGLDVCRAARARGDDVPILVVTASSGVDAVVDGLDAGADDYLGKPFEPRELLARVRALGRRKPRVLEATRTFGAIVIDRERRTVTRDGALVALTPREFELATLLAWADGRVVARGDILEAVWGEATSHASMSLEVLLGRIRRKLGGDGDEVVRTVRNVGYAWSCERSKPT